MNSLKEKILIAMPLMPIFLLPFFPLGAFWFAILALLVEGNLLNKLFRRYLGGVAFISLIIIIASRNYTDELNNDLSIYYNVYILLSAKVNSAIFVFGNGYEIGWPLLYYGVSLIFDNVTPIELAIINTSLCAFLVFIWIERYGLKNLLIDEKSIVLACAILLMSVQTFGYLQRQALSVCILLFSISNIGRKRCYVYLILSSLFHLSSLPIGILYIILTKLKTNNKTLIVFLVLTIIFKLTYVVFFNFISMTGLDIPGLYKIQYFIERANANTITSMRFALLIFPLLILAFFMKGSILLHKWRNVIIISCVLYIAFLGIPLAPERINFILLILYGYFLYLTLANYKRVVIIIGLAYSILFLLEKTNLIGSYDNLFWVRYPLINFTPFYYLY